MPSIVLLSLPSFSFLITPFKPQFMDLWPCFSYWHVLVPIAPFRHSFTPARGDYSPDDGGDEASRHIPSCSKYWYLYVQFPWADLSFLREITISMTQLTHVHWLFDLCKCENYEKNLTIRQPTLLTERCRPLHRPLEEKARTNLSISRWRRKLAEIDDHLIGVCW